MGDAHVVPPAAALAAKFEKMRGVDLVRERGVAAATLSIDGQTWAASGAEEGSRIA